MCGFNEVHVGVVGVGHVGELACKQVNAHHVYGYRVKAAYERARPLSVEGFHGPQRSRFAAYVLAAVKPVDEPKQSFAAQVFVPHEVYESHVFGRAVAVLVEVVVRVLAPVGIDARASVPVLAAQRYALPHMAFKQRHVYYVVGLGERRCQAACKAAVVL